MSKTVRIISCFTLSVLMSVTAWANLPYYPIQFPRDDAAHYDDSRYAPITQLTEWWYYNGKLTTKTGRRLGYYISYNYMAVVNKGKTILVPLFQMQVADIDNKKVYGGQLIPKQGTFSINPQQLEVSYGNGITLTKSNDTYNVDGHVVSADGTSIRISLHLTPTRTPLFENKIGLVPMWNNTNSYYYSYTNVKSEGYIQIGNEMLDIDDKQSLSWMDHQWGDFVMVPGKTTWMWSSIQLKNGMEMDLAQVVDPKTKIASNRWLDVVMPDNSRVYLDKLSDFTYDAKDIVPGGKHPLAYELNVPSMDLHLNMNAFVPGQDVNGIWEGISDVSGTYQGISIQGQANTENSASY